MRFRFAVAALALAAIARAQAPAVNAGGVVNAASYGGAGVAPGSIISIFGTSLASRLAVAGSTPLPAALDTVSSVTFNGVPAPLYFVSPGQINAQLPWNVLPSASNGSAVNMVITTSGGASAPLSVQVAAVQPGLFTANAKGTGQAIATDNADGAIAAAAGSIPGVNTHPIEIGGYLIVWCTGLGAVDASIANGANPGGIANTLAKPSVLIGGVEATPVYSVLSPQYPGEYQVAVQVAPGTPTGDAVPLQMRMSGTTTFGNVTIAVAGNSPAFQVPHTDCTLTSTGCTQIDLAATDPFSTSGAFGGYADATIRQDPLTGTLWMAYSWPHTIPSGKAGVPGTQVLDTHVSFSTDGGKSWTHKGALFTSQQVSNPVTGNTDYTAYEVMNLLPQVVNGVTYWFGIHSTYNVGSNGTSSSGNTINGPPSQEDYTKRWTIAMAPGTATDGPMGLATATPQYLGQPLNTYPQDWPVAVNLSSLDPELSGCTQYFEPSLVMSNNNLYLFLACTPNSAPNRFYAVFRTGDPLNNAPNWKWTYVQQGASKFANQRDAVSVGSRLGTGATYITQMDIAPSKNPGMLLAIMSATYDTAAGKQSLGCAAAELASIDPPKFVYNAQGAVQVDAFLTSTDSQTSGPGSCTYLPNSATGLILAHRQSAKAPQNGGFFTFLMQSFLFP